MNNFEILYYNKLYSFNSEFDSKIEKWKKLDQQEKINLGKMVSDVKKTSPLTIFKSIISYLTFSKDNYYTQLAEAYIQLKQRRQISQLRMNMEKVGLHLEATFSSNGSDPEMQLNQVITQLVRARTEDIKTLFKNVFSGSFIAEIEMKVWNFERLFFGCESELEGLDHKKKWFFQHLPSFNKLSAICAQARKFPGLHAIVSETRRNLLLCDNFDDQSSDLLKTKLKNQLENFAVIGEQIWDVASDHDAFRVFASLTFSDFFKEEGALAQQLLQGDRKISTQEKQRLSRFLTRCVESRKKELLQPNVKELTKKRLDSPLTTRAIQRQANLHRAMRKGKTWASQQHSLKKLGNSLNDVFKLQHPKTSKPVAFFKVGAGDEQASGAMEKLMWNIAVLLGKEDLFVPTGEVVIRDRSQLEGGSKIATKWTPNGDVEVCHTAQMARRGGIQVALRGRTLREWRRRNKMPGKKEIINATLASIVFGMFDAHDNNIFVTKKGEIKFFDNTRSLPNSNGFLDWGGRIIAAYRCSLLDLPVSGEALAKEECNFMKQEVSAYKGKVEKLEQYLRGPQGQTQLNQLPPGWMDLEASLSAMKERLNNMEMILASEGMRSLQDLVARSCPNYKFAYAIRYLERAINENDFSTDGMHNNWSDYRSAMKLLSKHGFDLQDVKKLCDDPNVTFENLGKKLKKHVKNLLTNAPLKKCRQSSLVNKIIVENAAVENKDLPRKHSEMVVRKRNLKIFKKLGIEHSVVVARVSLVDTITEASADGKRIEIVDDKGIYKVVYNSPTGYRIREIDIQSVPGKIRELRRMGVGEPVAIADFIESLKRDSSVPSFEQLPILEPSDLSDLFSHSGNTLILSKSKDEKYLVVSQASSSGTVVSQEYFSTSEGKFKMKGSDTDLQGESTIEEIINHY